MASKKNATQQITPPWKDTITLTVEVTPELFTQIQVVSNVYGQTVDEWLMDTIRDNV